MNERELSRRLSSSVVETLKAQGHILVVKGGAQALARELDELMASTLALIAPRLSRGVVMGEVTSTFGDDAVDEAVEDVVGKMTRALMDSDHVEDVFAEDNVIQRDVFRSVRDGLLQAHAEDDADDGGGGEDATVKVRLDTLGYVASTVAKRADPETLREALEQAAALVEAELVSFASDTREATFSMPDAGPDGRLDLEESVADELTALVEEGAVELPTIERRVDLGRDIGDAEQKQEQARIEAIASKTLHRSGCAASWEFVDPRTIRIALTPLSDQDSREIDQPVALFARGVASLLAGAPTASAAPEPPPSSDGAARRAGVAALKVDVLPAAKPEPRAAKPEQRVAKPALDDDEAPPAAKKPAAKATKTAAKKKPPAADKAPKSAAPKKAAAKASASAKTPAKKR